MPIATGIYKKLSIKKQAGQGTIAAPGAAGTAKYQRRVTSTIDLTKASYQSNEINTSQQVQDMRHGVRAVAGTISGELSVGGYQGPMESVLRQAVQAAATTGAILTVAAVSTGGGAGTFTRSAGSFITDGFNVGDIVLWSGWATTGVPNNAHNMIITGLTATIMTVQTLDRVLIGAKAAGDSVTCTLAGKKTWVPQTGHTRDYYTIEHFHADISQSEVFQDCAFTGMNISLPPTGMATIEFPVMGLTAQYGVVEYFTAPATAPTGGILAAVNGILISDGAVMALVTGLTLTVAGGHTAPGGVVGSNIDPDLFPGKVGVTGQATFLFQDGTMRDKFVNEVESTLVVALTANNTPNAPFTAFNLPRIKYSGATKDDGEKALTQTMPFTALENVNGGPTVNTLRTTMAVQDSTFA